MPLRCCRGRVRAARPPGGRIPPAHQRPETSRAPGCRVRDGNGHVVVAEHSCQVRTHRQPSHACLEDVRRLLDVLLCATTAMRAPGLACARCQARVSARKISRTEEVRHRRGTREEWAQSLGTGDPPCRRRRADVRRAPSQRPRRAARSVAGRPGRAVAIGPGSPSTRPVPPAPEPRHVPRRRRKSTPARHQGSICRNDFRLCRRRSAAAFHRRVKPPARANGFVRDTPGGDVQTRSLAVLSASGSASWPGRRAA
jgi:hypothetical protein